MDKRSRMMTKIIKGKSWVRKLVVFCICMSFWSIIPLETQALESVATVKQILIVNNEKGDPITGAVFEIQNENKEVLETAISNEQGWVEIRQTNAGRYLLKQIKTEEGYEIIKERPIEIKIENPVRKEVIINKIRGQENTSIAETGQENLKKNEDLSQGLEENTVANSNENSNKEDELAAIPEEGIKSTDDQVETVTTSELQTPSPEITVSEVINNSYKISVAGVSNGGGVTGVTIPTWSQINGQDDLKWETGTYVGNDTWEVIVNLSSYRQTFDTFISHIYICDKQGKLVFINQIEKTIEDPFNEVTLNITPNINNPNQFTISTVGYAGESGIGKVYFPTWTERNGQDDIHWYVGAMNNSGEYSVTVDNKDHGFETGIYNVHTYFYGLRGELLKTYTAIQKLEPTTPTINLTEVVGNSYKVQLSGVSNPEGVMGVYFPTWTQIRGQDDLRWETGKFIGNDTWEAIIHITDYNNSYDTFVSHAYIIDKNGQRKYIQSAEKIITNPFLEKPLQVTLKQDTEVSKFIMNTQNCANKTGIKGVSFAVWTNRNGQDEIKWYDGILGAGGEYFALADIEEHGFETGPYSVHTYLWGNGVENIAMAENTFTMPAIIPTIEYDKAVINNTFKMRIKNVGNENGVVGITFPTWSRTNGQDDLRWEPAIYIGNHTWETTINLRNYNIIVDEFISHAYLVDKSGKCILAKDTVKRILQNTATVYGFYCYPLDKYFKPNPGDPTDWFGPRWGDIHEGVDIPADRYASCYSVGNGVVEKAGYFMGYGRYVRIRTTDRYGESVSFFYGHLQEINVSVGQSVSMGQKIGSVGGSGYNAQGKYVDDAYGSHLHFGAIVNADYVCVDPEIWIDFHNPYSNV